MFEIPYRKIGGLKKIVFTYFRTKFFDFNII